MDTKRRLKPVRPGPARSVPLANLPFSPIEIGKMRFILGEMLKICGAKLALLVGRDGALVTMQGEPGNFDLRTLCNSIADHFAAAEQMARLLGEQGFSMSFRQGPRKNIHFSLIGDQAILAVLFNDRTTLGQVSVYATDAAAELTALIDEVTRRQK